MNARMDEIEDRAAGVDAAVAKIDDCEASDENYAITLVPHIVHSATEASALDVPALVAALRAVLALHAGWHVCVNADSPGAQDYSDTSQDAADGLRPCPTVRAITAALDAS